MIRWLKSIPGKLLTGMDGSPIHILNIIIEFIRETFRAISEFLQVAIGRVQDGNDNEDDDYNNDRR